MSFSSFKCNQPIFSSPIVFSLPDQHANAIESGKEFDLIVSNYLISSLIIFAGIALVGFGIFTFFRQRAQIAQFSRADGVVTELIPVRVGGELVVSRTEEGMKMEKKVRYRLQIQFKTQTGRTIEFMSPISTRPARYKVGERVEILYDLQNPKQAQVNSFLHLWFATLMFIFFGLFFVGMGLLGVVMSGV